MDINKVFKVFKVFSSTRHPQVSEEQPHAHPPQPVRVDGHPGAHPPGAVHRPGRHPHPLTHHRSGQERIQPVERHRQHGRLLKHYFQIFDLRLEVMGLLRGLHYPITESSILKIFSQSR